jgi:protein-S-isoprenylcysteine O-methyltransferase Ste14
VETKEETSGLRHDWPVWVPLTQAAGLLLFHGALPFGLSRLSYRHGWFTGQPALWNLAGLLPVAGGIAVIIWVIVLHRERAPRHGWRIEKTPFEPPRYLIVSGPYRYTRNPIYLSHLAIWIGWTLFYGSVAMMLGVLSLWTLLAFVIVPYEERGLARTLGQSYVQYQSQVARWFGRLSS